MTADSFPAHLARGISDSAFIIDGAVSRGAYAFDKVLRDDGRRELSIQWLDDDGAETEIKNRLKEGEPTFIRGFAILRTLELDELCHVYDYRGLAYARSPSHTNRYHGLILMNEVEKKIHRREIMSELALRSVFYPHSSKLPTGNLFTL